MIIHRQHYINRVQKALKSVPIVVLIGCRQVGKTTIMKSLTFSKPTIFLNGQDPENALLFSKLSSLESFFEIQLGKKMNGVILIDEFQYIPKVSVAIKLLTDKHQKLKVICTGSSSLDILQNVHESLAGRVRVIDVYSLSFEEYLQFYDEELHTLYLKYTTETVDEVIEKKIINKFGEYLIYGGFPRVAMENEREEKTALINDIYKTYLLRDIRSYIRNEDFVSFNNLLRLLSAQIGNLVNVNELSVSSKLSYRKCEEYISLLEQMYIIKLVEPIESNRRNSIKKMKKVYFTDLGLRNIIYKSFQDIETRIDNGALFENFVLLELLRKLKGFGQINFYRTTDGTEIDFILNTLKNLFIVEVKFKNLSKPIALKSIQNYLQSEQDGEVLLINKNFNFINNKTRFFQGYLVPLLELN